MKATVKRSALARELALLKAATDERAAITSLRDVLVGGRDGALTLRATNLEIALQSEIEAKIEGSGAWCVPARKFFDVVKALPDDEVRLSFGESDVDISSGSARFKFSTRLDVDFPKFQEPSGETVALVSSAVVDGLKRCLFASANDDARYFLSGALMEIREDKSLAFVVTDGHRLTYVNRAEGHGGIAKTKSVLIPRAAATLIASMVEDSILAFRMDDARMWFTSGKRVLSSRRVEGQFPQWDKVIGVDGSTRAVVSREAFSDALHRVSLLSSERTAAVKFEVCADSVKMHSASVDIGSASESVPAEVSSKSDAWPITLGFNGQYILEWLAVAGAAKVAFVVDGQDRQGTMATVGDAVSERDRYVVMPMKL